jgi:hypothetical protein
MNTLGNDAQRSVAEMATRYKQGCTNFGFQAAVVNIYFYLGV